MVEIKFSCPMCGGCVPFITLSCVSCGEGYEEKEGTFYLHRTDEVWSSVYREALGTIECLKADGTYKEDKPEYVEQYPYFDERDTGSDMNRVMFEMCLDLIGEKKGIVLDIGFKNGWAINQFLKRGFEGVATDITDDEKFGLGYAEKLIRHTGRSFLRVVCDGAYLPFEDSQFDVVFMCSTLHHFRDMSRGLREVCRVLKSGGVFVDMGDTPRHPDKSEQEAIVPAWREKYLYHIDEKQPTIPEYYAMLEQAGFSKYKIFPVDDTFLRNGFVFGTDKMLDKIRQVMERKSPHPRLQELCDQLSWKTKSMWTREDVFFLNWFLHTPNNSIFWGVK